jgi:competence protein ComEC
LGRVMVSTSGLLENFSKGQEIELNGVLKKPDVPIVEGAFDYRTYLERQGIYYQLTVESTNDWKALNESRTPFADRFFSWAQRVLQRGLPVEDESLRLVWAMTLGWKPALTDEVSEPFMRSGTINISLFYRVA